MMIFIAKFGIYALMALGVIAALGVVTLRNLFHSALALAVTLMAIAGIYVALHAEFLAVAQVLIYVGAVMTLIIFAIMLTSRIGDPLIAQKNSQNMNALIGALLFLLVLYLMIEHTPWVVNPQTLQARVSTADLGMTLVVIYVFPFEVISVVLIAALIGAVVMAKKEKE